MEPTKVTLTDSFQTTIQTRHHTYHADEPTQDGGTDTMVTPTEMLMGALGSCIVITMKMYAQRKGWPVESIEILLDTEKFASKDYAAYSGDAQFVHEIRERIRITGPLDADQRERLLDIASKCPVSRIIELPAYFQRSLLD